jgi:hypothetical protein
MKGRLKINQYFNEISEISRLEKGMCKARAFRNLYSIDSQSRLTNWELKGKNKGQLARSDVIKL